MRKVVIGAFITSAATAAAISITATPALAATWTVTPGGNVTGTSGTTILKDTRTGATITCQSSSTAATLQSGSNPLGTITSATFNNCVGPFGISMTVTSVLPWYLNGVSYDGVDVTTGNITNVRANISGFGCSLTASGSVNGGTFTNSTDVLAANNAGGLVISNVVGCLGQVANGDAATFTASYTITPGQTITSP